MEGLEAARASLQRLQDFIQRLHEVQEEGATDAAEAVARRAFEGFCSAMADDLNVSAALAALFDLVRESNALLDKNKMKKDDATFILKLLERCNLVLGVLSLEKTEAEVPSEIVEALKKREEARAARNWALADELRDKIINSGYIIEDTAGGARVKQASS
jgi:cysteinyl-tRNA synthetase